jgi:hypothetical protein
MVASPRATAMLFAGIGVQAIVILQDWPWPLICYSSKNSIIDVVLGSLLETGLEC